MRKTSYLYLLFPLIVFNLYLYYFLQIDNHLDSIFDEGFLFLKLQAARQGKIDGSSQWAILINTLLGEYISSNLLYLRYARYLFQIMSVTLFSVISFKYLINKGLLESIESKIIFLSLVFLFGSLVLGGILISYYYLQEFFLLGVISCFLIAMEVPSPRVFFLYILIGFFSFLSILTILPSGILVLISVILLMWIKYMKSWKTSLKFTSYVLIGMLVSAVFFHFFILDIGVIYGKMAETAQTLTKANRGYDPFSFLIKIILYFRDFYIITCLLLGMTLLSIIIKNRINSWLSAFFFLLSILIFSIYLKKPEIPLTSLLAFPIILLFISILRETSKIKLQDLFSFKVLLKIFLFLSPIISSIGTNVSLANRMAFFILPWSVLFIELMNDIRIKHKYRKEIQFLLWFLLILIAIRPIQSISNNIINSKETYYFKEGKSISKIKITKNQKEYFDKVFKIIKEYGYQPNDIIFSTQLDHMTICALLGTPCGLFFQPMDFLLEKNKQKLPIPDFLFLTEFDYSLISDSLKSLNWGFPYEFDKYFVGTPESLSMGYPTERNLYCRKIKK